MSKKLRWTDVGGCGGSRYVSQRQADVPVALRFNYHPATDWSNASLSISVLKAGTVGTYLHLAGPYEFDTTEQLIEYAQKFNDIVQDEVMTEEEQKAYDAYLAIKKAKKDKSLADAQSLMATIPPVTMSSGAKHSAHFAAVTAAATRPPVSGSVAIPDPSTKSLEALLKKEHEKQDQVVEEAKKLVLRWPE